MSIEYAAGCEYLDAGTRAAAKRLMNSWEANKLPENHPRVQAWEQATYSHQGNCYHDPLAQVVPFEHGKPGTIIFPITRFWSNHYGLRTFKDDARFSDEWRTAEKESIERSNQEIMALIESVCIPANHFAVQTIRRYYPEHEPRLDWIENRPENPGSWYETGDRPAPENCPGDQSVKLKHPTGGSWCQFCGWRTEKQTVA